MSRYPRYPPATVGLQRNPWVSDGQPPLDCRESQSTNSSSSSRPASLWLPHPHPERHPAEVPASAAVTTAIVGGGATNTNLLVPTIVKQSSRPVTPASSPGTGVSGGAVDGCGGHCVAFENFCYYCLQVIFIAGILTGISLTIAGSVLRSQQRGGDLLVLVYIGCMIAMVCTLLLSVQCCVRRNVKRRKRALRAQRHRRSNAGPQHEAMIPMQDLQPVPQPPQQYQPLLVHLVQQQQQQQQQQQHHHHQQQQQVCTMEGHHRHAPIYRHHHSTYRSGADQLDMSQSGTPWWRRHHTVETRH